MIEFFLFLMVFIIIICLINIDLKRSNNKVDVAKVNNDLFAKIIQIRGKEYFDKKKVTNYKKNKNGCFAVVKGTKNYNVTINYDENYRILDAHCNCPYFLDNNEYCKHIYALLLMDNIPFQKTIDNLRKEENYINNSKSINLQDNKKIISTSQNDTYYLARDIYKKAINRFLYTNADLSLNVSLIYNNITKYGKLVEKTNDDDLLYSYYLELKELYEKLDYEITKCEKNTKEKKEKENKRKELKERWGLDDREVDEVESGRYEPWLFEEEDLEEDDYYYDDV